MGFDVKGLQKISQQFKVGKAEAWNIGGQMKGSKAGKGCGPTDFGNAFLGKNYSTCCSTRGSDKVRSAGNPAQDAKNLAHKEGISEAQAGEKLKAKFGAV